MSLAYAECPLDVQDSLSAQYFVDAIRDEDTQNATRPREARDTDRRRGNSFVFSQSSAEHSKLCSVFSKDKTIIPARSECLIQGVPEVSIKFRYAVTEFPSQVSQKGVLVAATLVDLKREAIPVRVLNLDNIPMTIDKGAVIATCEPVVDIFVRPHEFSESLRLPSILENLEGLNEEQ
ncbi:hypothetical protein AVEN_68101-1 [Araneus ventricosus]|uniref:Uncharacterized protein n=1 Tax=Araneus ventricosus TaxID=182803 RepID=A0A4Y2IYC9_ARAVE|nr:hypothetical protein AVEN_68101-1 [Araneus ventricosus]